MLAVTEVNGCGMCSYHHTSEALKSGMSQEEISQLLSGNGESIPEDQGAAIMFAQHYADSRGLPSQEAWQRMLELYGETKSQGILGSTRMIMFGNAHGIAISALKSRVKGNRVESSSLLYEVAMALSVIPFLPVALIHSLFSRLIRKPLLQF